MNPVYNNDEFDKNLMISLFNQVNERVGTLPVNRILVLKAKLFLFTFIYILIFGMAVLIPGNITLFYVCYSFLGIVSILIFTNFIHEACHRNIFKKAKYNDWTYRIFDLLGANSFIWKKRHLILHHRYPNTLGWDADLEQKGPICIFPGENLKKYHRFQHLYIFLLYPLFLLNWIFVRDFRDFFSTKRVVRKVLKIPAKEYLNLIVFKSFYLLLIIGVPVFNDRANLLQAFTGLLMMTVTGSLLGMVILLTPHINEDNIFPATDENSKFHESWFRQQFLTTNDIKANNWFVRHIMGNFNYHLCHHLFPGISSIYAPEVTQVIEKFAHENSLPYRSLTLTEALRKHYRLIYKNAQFARREYLI